MRKTSVRLYLLLGGSVVFGAAFMPACTQGSPGWGTSGEPPVQPRVAVSGSSTGTRVHVMPVRKPPAALHRAAAPNAHLTYYGGPVISAVKIYTVFWGSAATTYQTQLGQFFGAITSSAYF